MTEYAHNHPPRCCCEIANDETAVRGRLVDCPLCPEHGELAQLSNTNPPNDIPANVTPRTDYEYACCHQLVGRPHTDYCPSRHGQQQSPAEVQRIAQANLAANPLGMRHQPQTHTLDGDTHPVHECHPDRCGMWATTTQPPSQTSTPQTQARDLAARVEAARDQHADDRVLEDNKGQRWHETGPDEAHETWRCTPAKCGRERTPLATPTPPADCQACAAAGVGVITGLPHTCGQAMAEPPH